MNDYEAKQDARRARLEQAADRARDEAARRRTAADNAVAGIPPGQPILVGHHSEGRHRRDLAKCDSNMRKAIEADEAADELAHRAAAVGTGGISSDNPDAIELLRDKVEQLTRARERMKALNALFRRQGTLHASDLVDADEQATVLSNMRHSVGKPVPFPAYALINIGARIRQAEQRIEELSVRATMVDVPPQQIGDATVSQDLTNNRVLLTFPARLSKEDYKTVRAYGFVWSATRRAFVRKLGPGVLEIAITVAQSLAKKPRHAVQIR